MAPAVANPRLPNPSVFKNCPALPSDVGKVNPLIVTPPDPLPESSRLAFDAFDDTVLSEIVTPSIVKACVVLRVVKVPAKAVVPPITVLSMVSLVGLDMCKL